MATAAVKTTIISAISAQANKTIASAQEKYFREVVRFRGLKAPTMDKIYKELMQREELKKLKREEHIELAFDLLTSEYFEDKRFGTFNPILIIFTNYFVKYIEGISLLKHHARSIASPEFVKVSDLHKTFIFVVLLDTKKVPASQYLCSINLINVLENRKLI